MNYKSALDSLGRRVRLSDWFRLGKFLRQREPPIPRFSPVTLTVDFRVIENFGDSPCLLASSEFPRHRHHSH